MKFFVARQPIVNRQEQVVAYELLFRSGNTPAYDGLSGDDATTSVIAGAFLLLGLDKATNHKRAFINFTHNLLRQEIATQLSPQSIVVELLEDIDPDEEVLAICQHLKQLGYTLALDDFIFAEKYRHLANIIDIIKVDFLVTLGEERRQVIESVNAPHINFLAEKVETRADFEEALALGYTFFQGYFFSRPELLSEEDMPSHKAQYLRVLQEIQRPDLNYNRMEEIIKYDVAFSYKLLKYVNSASFGFRQPISSIKHALLLLGQRQVERWLSLLILREMSRDNPDEIIKLSVTRAKFGETLAQKLSLDKLAPDLFLIGLFSLLDCILKRPMEDILKDLPLTDQIKNALLGADTLSGNILQLIISYEKGNWGHFSHYAEKCRFNEEDIPDLYLAALHWTEEFFTHMD